MKGWRGSMFGWLAVTCSATVGVGCGSEGDEELTVGEVDNALVATDAAVTFIDCTEFAGIGVIPATTARQLVPPQYAIAGDESNAIIVVRAAHCGGISVGGTQPQPGTVSQVGITLAAGDETADINNYTVWFGTTSGPLHAALRQRGVSSELDGMLSYSFNPNGGGSGTLSISATPPMGPSYAVSGAAIVPVSPATSFVATWWAETDQGSVSMRTEFPEIRFSSATTELSTDPGSAMAALIGGDSLGFPILDSYNSFPEAALVVDVP